MNFLLLLASIVSLASALPATTNAKRHLSPRDLAAIDGSSNYPAALTLSGTIEGASVSSTGEAYAVNSSSMINLKSGEIVVSGSTDQSTLFFASSRFTKTLGTLIGDAVGHTVWVISSNSTAPTQLFPPNPAMLQPNDMAISADESMLYFSGMHFQDTSVAGQDGELWYYSTATKTLTQVDKSLLAAAGIYRTNGIELSPDGTTLYLSSAQNENGVVVAAKVFAFTINQSTGAPENPTVIFDIYGSVAGAQEAQADPDGMRSDTAGTVFMTLNGGGQVLKFDPASKTAEVITLPTVKWPANLELVGEQGTELVVVGKCEDGESSCIDVYQHNVPGKAWSALQ